MLAAANATVRVVDNTVRQKIINQALNPSYYPINPNTDSDILHQSYMNEERGIAYDVAQRGRFQETGRASEDYHDPPGGPGPPRPPGPPDSPTQHFHDSVFQNYPTNNTNHNYNNYYSGSNYSYQPPPPAPPPPQPPHPDSVPSAPPHPDSAPSAPPIPEGGLYHKRSRREDASGASGSGTYDQPASAPPGPHAGTSSVGRPPNAAAAYANTTVYPPPAGMSSAAAQILAPRAAVHHVGGEARDPRVRVVWEPYMKGRRPVRERVLPGGDEADRLIRRIRHAAAIPLDERAVPMQEDDSVPYQLLAAAAAVPLPIDPIFQPAAHDTRSLNERLFNPH